MISLVHTSDFALGTIDSLLVRVLLRPVRAETMEAISLIQRKVVEQYGMISLLTILTPAATRTQNSAELGAASHKMALEFRPHVLGNVYVIQGLGFTAVSSKAFISSLSLVTDIDMPWATTIAEACRLLSALPEQSEALRAADLITRAVEAFVLGLQLT